MSGLFTSAFALGNFAGPTLSGILYDSIGFSYNCLVIQACLAIMTHESMRAMIPRMVSLLFMLFQGIVLLVALGNMAAYITLAKTRNTEVDATRYEET